FLLLVAWPGGTGSRALATIPYGLVAESECANIDSLAGAESPLTLPCIGRLRFPIYPYPVGEFRHRAGASIVSPQPSPLHRCLPAIPPLRYNGCGGCG